MISLLKSDLYRAWHRSDGFWNCMLAIVGIVCVLVGLSWFTMQHGSVMLASIENDAGKGVVGFVGTPSAPTYLWSQTTVTSWFLGFLCACLALYNVGNDFSSGFARTYLSSVRGRVTYLVEKFVLAGVMSAIALFVAIAVTTVGLLVAGFRFSDADSVAFVLVWLVCVWLTCWAVASVVVALMLSLRSMAIGILWVFAVAGGGVEGVLQLIALPISWGLGTDAPIRAVETFNSWLPTANFALLNAAAPVGNVLDVPVASLAHAAVCSLGLIAASVAIVVATQRRHDVA